MATRRVSLIVCVVALLGACADNPLDDNFLVDRGTVRPGDACTAGGTIVRTGPDLDGNGLLEPSEAKTRSIVCWEQAVDALVVRQSPRPRGDDCPVGGWTVDIGLDIDKSGVLDDSEVLKTSLTCQPQ